MAGTTTNNGWDYPTSTDLVKDGATAIQTLADDIDTSSGKTFLAWTTFAPTWTNLTVGNGSYGHAAYVVVGKTAHVSIDFTLGTTSSISGDVTLTLPAALTRKTAAAYTGTSTAMLIDAGVGNYIGSTLVNTGSATQWLIRASNAGATYTQQTALSSTIPFTWGSTDRIQFAATFEVA